MSPRQDVQSLLDLAINSLRELVCIEAQKVVQFIRNEIFTCAGRHNKNCIEEIPEITQVWQKLQDKINQHVHSIKVCFFEYHNKAININMNI